MDSQLRDSSPDSICLVSLLLKRPKKACLRYDNRKEHDFSVIPGQEGVKSMVMIQRLSVEFRLWTVSAEVDLCQEDVVM